ncbi:MAG TPA: zinc ribbon domain-containing protein [Terriglobales bacterium]|nr:zinc ribbon domain-containing protein [Terriglobales bacterium]
MFCNSCGTHIQAGQTVCPKCGQTTWASSQAGVPVAAPGVAPVAPNRVVHHVNTLGILWMVYGVLTGFGGVMMLIVANAFFGPWMQNQETPMPPFIRPMIGFIGTILIIVALARVLAGWGLYAKQGWGRILALIMGFISLIDFPFGTALGIYSIWVLLSPGAEQQYHQLSYAR